ncbi:MAG: hypothetical protein HY275_04110 [Gemmatimonadetes bacterium]|nr:hypothetical protein [Gemmatimonadota bacterium]
MTPHITRALLSSLIVLAACADRDVASPVSPAPGTTMSESEGRGAFQRYVAIGTSVSEGWASDGLTGASQRDSWPRQLARLAHRDITQPYVQDPGCRPPLLAPLAAGARLGGYPAAPTPFFCAPLEADVSLPTQNLAIVSSTTLEALTTTPEGMTDPERTGIFARTLPPGMTQVSAMMAQNPKFVSVEFGANEILAVHFGFYAPGVNVFPVAAWKPLYRQLIDSVAKATRQGVVVGLIDDMRNFPAFRSGPELWAERATFASFNVVLSPDCATTTNWFFVPSVVPIAIGTGAYYASHGFGPYTYTCADQGGLVEDGVLSAADVAATNAQLAEMNTEIEAQARRIGFAYFKLSALYERPDVRVDFSVGRQLTTSEPYGPYFSLDGLHPSALGHAVLAAAAARAINRRYDFDIPVPADSWHGVVAARHDR